MKLALTGSLARILLRATGMALNAATYAIAARALSRMDMGLWALATAMTTIALSLDLGLSSHLRNRLAESAKGDPRQLFMRVFTLCAVIAAAYLLLLVIACCGLLGTGWTSTAWWTPVRQTLATAIVLGLGLLFVRMPFNLAANAFYSFNEPNYPIYWEVVNFVASFVLVAIALWTGAGVVAATVAFLAGGTLASIGCSVHFLRRRHWTLQWLRPAGARKWLADASSFGLLQILALGLSTTPSFVVGSLVRLEEVTVARATMILCQAVLSLHQAHAMPLWTELTQLRQSDDWHARLVTLRRRLLRETGLLFAAFGVLALVLPWGIGLWLNRSADFRVTTAFCLWGAGCGIANLHSLILNGANRPLVTAAALVPGTALAAGLAWKLAPTLGSPGVGLAFAAGAGLTAALMIVFARRQLAEIDGARA